MNPEIKTRIIGTRGAWRDVVMFCRATVGKPDLGRDPSAGFKRKILIAEHSPIREIRILWSWDEIKSWVATHFSRHKWECYVKSQRTDRTGIDRENLLQNAPVSFAGSFNVQAAIDTARKRLCYQAAPETRKHMESLKWAIHDVEPEIADVMVPNCVYRGGCPEMKPCGYFERLLAQDPDIGSHDIQKRYNAYNKMAMEVRGCHANTES